MNWKAGDPLPRYHHRVLPAVRDPQDHEVYHAVFVELPGCSAHGATSSEAIARLWGVLPNYLEQMAKFGAEIPDPRPQGEVRIGRVFVDFVVDVVVDRVMVVREPAPSDNVGELQIKVQSGERPPLVGATTE